MKYFVSLLLLCIFSLSAEEKNNQLPIDIEADSGFFDQETGKGEYSGNVVVRQGVATIWADTIVIFTNNSVAHKIEARGKENKIIRFEYNGKKQPITGQAINITYFVSEKKVSLLGDAEIKQGKDSMQGKEITYNLEKETMKGQKIKMTFQPM